MDPEPQKNEDPIDRLERDLYYKKADTHTEAREQHELEHRGFSVRQNWRHDRTPDEVRSLDEERRAERKLKLSHYVLIFSLIFFVISSGVAAYFFFGGANLVSPDKINIEIAGPVATDAGAAVPLQIVITNTNAATLSSVDLVVRFPEGTRSAVNTAQDMPLYREQIGSLVPGGQVERVVRSTLYGEQGEKKIISVTLEYQVAGSNAVFFKEQTYELVIGSASVRVSVESVGEITAGEEMEFTVEIASNSDVPIDDVLLLGEYPSGFAFTSAAPEPEFGTSIWRIGSLEPEEKKIVKVRGIVDGQDEESRVFRFTAGIVDPADETRIGTPLLALLRTVTIKKPFLGINVRVNGKYGGSHVVLTGERVNVGVGWVNNLPTQIVDAEIEVALLGPTFDKRSVDSEPGLYRANNNTILWNAQTSDELLSIEPGAKGEMRFSFAANDYTKGTALIFEPSADIMVTVRGKRVSEDAVPETIVSSAKVVINVAPAVHFTARATYNDGPFEDTGPVPPKVDTETLYTVTWSVKNTTSDVRDVEISTTLPAYIRWVGTVSPAGERMIFVPVGGRLVWNAGLIPAGAGYTRPAREVSFQIGLTPSITQIGDVPFLINNSYLTGIDSYTDLPISQSVEWLTTRVTNNTGWGDTGKGTVVP